jgi:hypothetical protein
MSQENKGSFAKEIELSSYEKSVLNDIQELRPEFNELAVGKTQETKQDQQKSQDGNVTDQGINSSNGNEPKPPSNSL